jgi:hypothetical protein
LVLGRFTVALWSAIIALSGGGGNISGFDLGNEVLMIAGGGRRRLRLHFGVWCSNIMKSQWILAFAGMTTR